MIKYERGRQTKCTPGMLRSLHYYRENSKVHKRGGKSVHGVRRVTYLVSDGFLKPSLIYWPEVLAVRVPFSLYEVFQRNRARFKG